MCCREVLAWDNKSCGFTWETQQILAAHQSLLKNADLELNKTSFREKKREQRSSI